MSATKAYVNNGIKVETAVIFFLTIQVEVIILPLIRH